MYRQDVTFLLILSQQVLHILYVLPVLRCPTFVLSSYDINFKSIITTALLCQQHMYIPDK